DGLVMLAGACLDRSTGDLPVLQPAGRITPERDPLFGVVVGGVPAVLVDLPPHRDRVRFGVDAADECVRRFVNRTVWSGVADAPAFRRQLFDTRERPLGHRSPLAARRRGRYVENEVTREGTKFHSVPHDTVSTIARSMPIFAGQVRLRQNTG